MARIEIERAKRLYPSCEMGVAEWAAFFHTPAGLQSFGRIVYDIYDEVKSQEERNAGLRRIGRRPGRSAIPLDEIMRMIFPHEFDNRPLNEQIRPHVRSQRQFAAKVPIAQSNLSKILNGNYDRRMSISLMERLAAACNLRPWSFPEWRAAYISALVQEVLLEAPHLGIGLIRNLRDTRARHEGVESA